MPGGRGGRGEFRLVSLKKVGGREGGGRRGIREKIAG